MARKSGRIFHRIIIPFAAAAILAAPLTPTSAASNTPEPADDEDSSYIPPLEETSPPIPPSRGSSLYISLPRTSAQLSAIYSTPRQADMHVIGSFQHQGDEITFGTYVTSQVNLPGALDASYREAFEEARGSDAPSLVAHVPLYRQIDYSVPGGQDYQRMVSQEGVSSQQPAPTAAQEQAAYQRAISEANAAAASEIGTTEIMLPLAKCASWRPKYSYYKAGNHRIGYLNGWFYYGKVHTRFKWSGTQMRNLLDGCGRSSGWEQDFFMDPSSGTWIRSPLRNWSTNVPSLYADTTFGDAGTQFGFGVVRAAFLRAGKSYYIAFTAPMGGDQWDKAGLTNDRTKPARLLPSCFSKWCMFVEGRSDVRRGVTVPMYITWLTPI